MKIENINLQHHITVDADVIQKLTYILDSKYDKEFTAFCHAEKKENGEYRIFDVFFPRQDNTATTTECDSEDIIALMKEGLDISIAGGHAHSHVDMQVFASGTDKTDILERAKDSGFNAAIIMNKKGHIFGHIADMDLGIYIQDCSVYINYPFETETFEDFIMDKIKNAESLDDIKTLANSTHEDFMDSFYPLSTEQKEFLDDVIKTRFKTKYNNYSSGKYGGSNYAKGDYGNSKKNRKVIENDNLFDDLYDDTPESYQYIDSSTIGNAEVAEDIDDFYSTEELVSISENWYKPYSQLTDSEYAMLEECRTFFPSFVPY